MSNGTIEPTVEQPTNELPTIEQDENEVKNEEPAAAAATETTKKARRTVGKLASNMLGKPLKLFSSNATKKSAAPATPEMETLPAVAFDIEVQKRAGAVAPPSLLERIMQRGTSLAASADARHLGAATRRTEAAAEVKRRLADNAVRRQAAAARRAAAPPQEPPGRD